MSGASRVRGAARSIVLACLLIAVVHVGAVQPAGAQQPADARGPGNGSVRATTIPHGVGSSPPAACSSDALDARSEPGYEGSYSVVDQQGRPHSYQGPLTLVISADVFENEQGTFDNSACAGDPGFPQPLRDAFLASPPGGTSSLACSYDLTQSTYSRHDRDLINLVLVGTCSITDDGATYVAATVEAHHGQVFERYAVESSSFPGAQLSLAIRWSDAFSASTACLSASCGAQGPSGAEEGPTSAPGPGSDSGSLPPLPIVGGSENGVSGASVGPERPTSVGPPPAVGAGQPSELPPGTVNDALALADDEDAGGAEDQGGWLPRGWWHRPPVLLALLALGLGEAASYRKQKRAGRPVFPLLSRVRLLIS